MKANLGNIDYSALWDKLVIYAKKAGRAGARPLVLLYYVMTDSKTPVKDKVIVFSALAYVLLPTSLISAKRFPVIGLVDEVFSISVAYEKVSKYVTPEIEQKADALLDKWFESEVPDYGWMED